MITGGLQEHAQPQLLQESGGSANKGSFKLRLNIPKPRKDKAQKQKANSALPGEEGAVATCCPPPAAPKRGWGASLLYLHHQFTLWG